MGSQVGAGPPGTWPSIRILMRIRSRIMIGDPHRRTTQESQGEAGSNQLTLELAVPCFPPSVPVWLPYDDPDKDPNKIPNRGTTGELWSLCGFPIRMLLRIRIKDPNKGATQGNRQFRGQLVVPCAILNMLMILIMITICL